MKKLERSLGLPAVLIIGLSAMMGTGLFITPGIAFQATGPSMSLAFLLGTLIVLPAAMSMAELATAMPNSGGIYVYTDRTFGPLAGTVVGLGLWISLLLKCAFALKGYGEYLAVFTNIPVLWTCLGMLALITLLNLGGIGKVATFLSVIVIACLVIVGVTEGFSFDDIERANMRPFYRGELSGFLVAVSLAVGAFAGLTKLVAISEEVKDPEVNLSKGILYSLLTMGVLFSLSAFLLSGALPSAEINHNLKPFYTLAHQALGETWAQIMSVMAILTLISMANAGLLAASRFPFAMGRDSLLPSFLGELHRKLLTPVASILLSSAVIAVVLLTFNVDKIAKMASIFFILIFMLVNFTVVVLRENRVQWYAPRYKSPFYPLSHLFGVMSGLVLLVYMGQLTVFSLLLMGIPSLAVYLFFGRKRTRRKGVLGIRSPRTDIIEDAEGGKQAREFPVFQALEKMDLSHDARVVVTLFGVEQSPEMLTEMGLALAEDDQIEVAHLTEVPEQTELNDILDPPRLKSLRRRIKAMAVERKKNVHFDPVATHDVQKTIFDISQRMHCQWLLIEWTGKTSGTFTFHDPIGWLKSHLQCHLAVFRDNGIRYIRKILVILKGNKNDDLVVDTADHLATVHKAVLTFTRTFDRHLSEQEKEKWQNNLENLAKDCDAKHGKCHLVENEHPLEELMAMSVDYDLVVFGATPSSFWQRMRGTLDDTLFSKAECSVLYVHASQSVKFLNNGEDNGNT